MDTRHMVAIPSRTRAVARRGVWAPPRRSPRWIAVAPGESPVTTGSPKLAVHTVSAVFLFVFVLVAILPPALRATPAVYADVSNTQVVLGNRYLERGIQFGRGILGTAWFRNKISGSLYAVSGDEFQIRLHFEPFHYEADNPLVLTARDFRIVDRRVLPLGEDGKRAVFYLRYSNSRPSLQVDAAVTYELRPGDFYTRKNVALSTPKDEGYFVSFVAVERSRWTGVALSENGLGQPLIGKDLFLGLEWPSSINTVRESSVSLGQYAGERLSSREFQSECAVIGVAAGGDARAAFLNYIDRIRLHPSRPFLVYLAFYSFPHVPDLGGDTGVNVTSSEFVALISQLRRELIDKYYIHLDSLTNDGGWDDPNRLWEINRRLFPDGFREVSQAATQAGSHFGLWFSPMGGYSTANKIRRKAAAREGMEIISSGEFLDLAGPKYSHFISDRLSQLENEYDINYFKFDGLVFSCNDTQHGHPVGIYSRETSVRNLLEILRRLRASKPHAFLSLATGPWRSPWWLRYGDNVDWGHGDFGYSELPSITQRQRAISYSDGAYWYIQNREHAQFPLSSVAGEGLIKAKLNMLGGEHESLDDWTDATVNLLGAANSEVDLYISPELLSSEEWAVLARTLKYLRANAHPLFDNATFVLGEPLRREPYGYVHYSLTKSIIVLRNPFIRPTTADLKLERENGFEPDGRSYTAEVIYPYRTRLPGTLQYGQVLRKALDGYEETVIELRAETDAKADLSGARYSIKPSGAGNELTFQIYAPKGVGEKIEIDHVPGLQEIRLDGSKIAFHSQRERATARVSFGRTAVAIQQPGVSMATATLEHKPNTGPALRVKAEVDVPADLQHVELDILLEPQQAMERVRGEVQVNGRPGTLTTETSESGSWYWFKMVLNPGRDAVNLALDLPRAMASGARVTAWLRGRRELAGRQLTLVFSPGQRVPSTTEDLLPESSPLQRETYALFERQVQ